MKNKERVGELRFSKKATKFETISHMIWWIKWEIVSNFCGLFRMSELYYYTTLPVTYTYWLENFPPFTNIRTGWSEIYMGRNIYKTSTYNRKLRVLRRLHEKAFSAFGILFFFKYADKKFVLNSLTPVNDLYKMWTRWDHILLEIANRFDQEINEFWGL